MKERLLLIILLSILLPSMVWAEQKADVSIDRDWGLLIGDEFTLQVTLPVVSSEIDRSSLPEKEARYGTWFYLKDRDLEGHTLNLLYQIVNVPVENIQVFTPEFAVRQLNDEWITVPSVPLIIGSALVKEIDMIVAKPDHPPILLETESIKNTLILLSVIAVGTSILWLMWHIGWHPAQRKPFAHALYELSRLKWRKTEQDQQAARILHTAFNRTANTIVVAAEIEVLFEQAPWLQDLEDDIAEFYQQSAHDFFTQDSEQELKMATIVKLAKACRSKEKLA